MEVDEEGDVEDWEMWDVEEEEWEEEDWEEEEWEEEEWDEEEEEEQLSSGPPSSSSSSSSSSTSTNETDVAPAPKTNAHGRVWGQGADVQGDGRQGGLHSLADSIMLLPFLLQKGLQKPKPKGLQKPKPKGLQKPMPKGLQKPKPQGLQKPKPKVASRKVMALETLQKGRTLQKVRTLEKVRTLQKVRTLGKVKSRVGVTPKGLEKPRGGKALKKVSPRRPNLLQKREAKPLVRGQKMMRPLRSSWPTSEGLP